MTKTYPVLAFVGHGRCGKDTACEWLSANTPIRFSGGCSYTVLPHIARDLGLSPYEAYARRHEDRVFWYEWCNNYRRDDPARIIRESLDHSDVVCGVRDRLELLTARDEGLVELIVWVDRDVPVDPTLTILKDDADIVLRNFDTLASYYFKVSRLVRSMGIPVR